MQETKNVRQEQIDATYMKRALELAEQARGKTDPNPLVGCVVVKNGAILAEGYHQSYGTAHAERDALMKLKPGEAEGSTLYVTLEPCCHTGKQPPCTDLIIASGVSRVVVGAIDSNPLVTAAGIRQLEAAGIRVTTGVLEAECFAQNHYFHHYMKTGLPYVALKYAMTLDGKIATSSGDSKWITGEHARAHVQTLRRDYAGILVGIGTVLADDPLLTCRIDPAANPTRIICDNSLRIPEDSQIVRTAKEVPTLVVCNAHHLKDIAIASKRERLEEAGIKILVQEGAVSLPVLLRQLAEEKIISVLVEGGSRIHASFLSDDLADYVYAYIAPKLIGGLTAPGPVGGSGKTLMADAVLLDEVKFLQFGNDCLISGAVLRTKGKRTGEVQLEK